MLDIASYQSDITVQQIKQSGAKVVVVKLTESTNYTNPYIAQQNIAQQNIAQQIKVCQQAGIQHIHFYHFQRATSVSKLTAEANYCVSVAKQYGYEGSFIFLDAELKEAVPSAEAIQSFYQIIRKAGYRVGFYTYKFMYPLFHKSVFNSCDGVWAAAYPLGDKATDQAPNMAYFPSVDNCVAWQFTDNWCGMHIDGSYTLTDVLLQRATSLSSNKDTYLHSGRVKKIITRRETGLYDGIALSKAKVLATIPKGTTLPVTEAWFEGSGEHELSRFKLEYNGQVGWVSGNDEIVESAYWLMDSYGKKIQVRMRDDDYVYADVSLQKDKMPVYKGDIFTIETNTTDPAGYPRLKTSFGMYLSALKSLTEWV